METALPYLKDDPPELPVAEHPRRRCRGGSCFRDGTFQLDNGLCRHTITVQYFDGQRAGEDRELQAERGRGAERRRARSYDAARARLAAQPLTPVVVYKPASRGQQLHVVVKQLPAKGRLSSYDKVTIVFAKPLHGVDPEGRRAEAAGGARRSSARLKLDADRARAPGTKIVRQRPRGAESPPRPGCRSRSG